MFPAFCLFFGSFFRNVLRGFFLYVFRLLRLSFYVEPQYSDKRRNKRERFVEYAEPCDLSRSAEYVVKDHSRRIEERDLTRLGRRSEPETERRDR